jgi:glycerate kinase
MGKAISGVAARAAAAGVPVIVIAGMVDVPSLAQSAKPGYTFRHVAASSNGPVAAVAQRITNLRAATARVAGQIETILHS